MKREELIIELINQGYFYGSTPKFDDDLYDPTSYAFVRIAWEKWVETLPDELKEAIDIGGGKTEMRPRWIAEVFDCDSHVHCFAAYIDTSFALDSARSGQPRGNPAIGFLAFSPDAQKGTRHAVLWYVDYQWKVQAFDPGLGAILLMSDAERQSIDELGTL